MGKGIMGFFRGRNEYQDHTQRSAAYEPLVIVCSGCGAKNLISNNSVCEYCGSPILYNADGKTVPSDVTPKQDSDLSDKVIEYILTTGFYTAGIDIPVGKCNVSAVSGSGNITSSDYGINEVFGTERGDVASFKGLKLPRDVTVEISGRLTIKLVYKTVDDGISGRTYNITGAMDISAGNYAAGTDFKAGTYNLEAVSGTGNICTGDIEVNEVFGLDEEDVHEIKNVYLPEGAELSIDGNLTIKLIPAVTK